MAKPIRLASEWAVLPPRAVGVNRLHPLCPDDVVTPDHWGYRSGTLVPRGATRYGNGLKGDSASYVGKIVRKHYSTAVSLLYVGSIHSDDLNPFCGIGNSGSGTQFFGFQFEGGSEGPRAVIRCVDGGGISSVGLGALTSQEVAVWIAIYDGTGVLKMYKNGASFGASNNTAATGSVVGYDRLTLGGVDRGTDTYSLNSIQVMIAAYNRVLQPAEISKLSTNPFQFFQP